MVWIRRFDDAGNVQLILMAVVVGVALAVSIVLIYGVLGGIDYAAYDTLLAENVYGLSPGLGGDETGPSAPWEQYNVTTPATNASDNLAANINTFYTIAPIYLVVLAAVAIIAAVMMITVRRGKQ